MFLQHKKGILIYLEADSFSDVFHEYSTIIFGDFSSMPNSMSKSTVNFTSSTISPLAKLYMIKLAILIAMLSDMIRLNFPVSTSSEFPLSESKWSETWWIHFLFLMEPLRLQREP